MPSFREGRTKPWVARVKIDGITYCLGYYKTKWQAEGVEQDFRQQQGVRGGRVKVEYTTDKPERVMWLKWMFDEFDYYADKKNLEARKHDPSLPRQSELNDEQHTPQLSDPDVPAAETFWADQILQYLARAKTAFKGGNPELGKQQLAKMITTTGGMLESVIRVYGPLPLAGTPSGIVNGPMKFSKPGRPMDIAGRELQMLITPKNICGECHGLGHVPSQCEGCKGTGIDPTKASQGLVDK